MQKSVSIINCIGYLGSELISVLLTKGYRIKGLVPTIFNARDLDYVHEMERKFPGGIEIFEYDATEKDTIRYLVDDDEIVRK